MKKLVASVALAASMLVAGGAHAGVEGCIATPGTTCTYVATVAGSIAGAVTWTVEVWWNGTCDAGAPNWVRSSANGDNNLPGGLAGTWEGSIAAGSCARATAGAYGAVAIGSIGP